MKKELVVISLGGSLIVPEKVDVKFLKEFKKIILKNTKKHKFVIVCGGGSIARKYIQALHARKMQHVFGEDLECPVQFVVCWTPDGCEHDDLRFKETGGTGQAISAASLNDIPVYNLANAGRLEELKEYCDNKTLQYSDYL